FGSIKNLSNYYQKSTPEEKQSRQQIDFVNTNQTKPVIHSPNLVSHEVKVKTSHLSNLAKDLKPANVLNDKNFQQIETTLESKKTISTKEKLDFKPIVDDDENIPRRKNVDNNLVFEMLGKSKKEEALPKDQDNDHNSQLNSKIFNELEKNLKDIEEKSNSSFSLNFLEEQTKLTGKNSENQQDQSIGSSDAKTDDIKTDSNSINGGSMLSLNSTNSQTPKSKSSGAFTIEELPEWVKLEAHVIVTTKTVMNKRGRIKFIGKTKFGNGVWIGVELEDSFGINDGSIKDI
ncbi:kinesin KIF13B isoform X3, partial [Brachionus plicatilis]